MNGKRKAYKELSETVRKEKKERTESKRKESRELTENGRKAHGKRTGKTFGERKESGRAEIYR